MKKLLYAGGMILLLQVSCTKDFEEINTDPTQATASNFDPNYLLSDAQFTFANTGYSQLLYPSMMVQVLASTYNYYGNGDKYVNTGQSTDYQGRIFTDGYTAGSRLFEAIRLARSKDSAQYSNLIQICRITWVLIAQRITDTYGDVPYSEALRAKDGIKFPKYDRQQDIYNSMLAELEDATGKLDATKAGPATDLFYGGNIEKWRRFGNSLMVRVAMRLTEVDAATAQTWTEKAAAGGTLQNVGENALVKADAVNATNATTNALRTADDFREVRWSKTFIDALKARSDPRLPAIAEVAQPGLKNNTNQTLPGNNDPALQIGMPNGYDLLGGATDIRQAPGYPGGTGTSDDVAPLGSYSRPRIQVYYKYDQPNFVLTYAETELLLAEAKARGWNIPGTAAEHYRNGLAASLEQMAQLDPLAAISTSTIVTFVNSHPLDESSLEKTLEMINVEYWLETGSTFNFIENWSNWRRSEYPRLTPVNYPGNVTNGTIPRRMIYLSTEILNNPENYRAAVGNLAGGDLLTSRVWWDQ